MQLVGDRFGGVGLVAFGPCRGGIAAFAFPAHHLARFLLFGGGDGGGTKRGERCFERFGSVGERDAVLRTLGSGDAGLDGGEIEFDDLRVGGVLGFAGVEEALLFGVCLDECDVFVGASGHA